VPNFVVLLACKSVDRSNVFATLWNYKNQYSILIITFLRFIIRKIMS